MKSYFTILFLFVLQLFFAQEEEMVYADGVFQFEENTTQKIFTDWTRVRQNPDISSPILDSLPTNQQILILNKDETIVKLGQRRAHWYKVSYQTGDHSSEGYIWGGNLCVGYRNKDGYDFLFGISKTVNRKDPKFHETYEQNIAGVKMMEGASLIDEVTFNTGKSEELSFAAFTVESGHKLRNVSFTLKATVSGEACGIASYSQYVLIVNQKLVVLPQLMNVGDADIFYHSEEFVFPNDKGGVANAFIFKMKEMERDEVTDKEKIKKASKTYFWTGSSNKWY